MKLSDMNKNERSLLLFFETCAVDNGGLVDTRHMNDEDHAMAKFWSANGFVDFGRVRASDILNFHKPCSHWVELSKDAWRLAHEERRARAERMDECRSWKRTSEINGAAQQPHAVDLASASLRPNH